MNEIEMKYYSEFLGGGLNNKKEVDRNSSRFTVMRKDHIKYCQFLHVYPDDKALTQIVFQYRINKEIIYGSLDIGISPQYPIKNYRADFLLVFGYFDRDEKQLLEDKIIIEIDGHDFHEKTKEQAANDKRRDREFASLGYTVLRYTGSEVFRSDDACVSDTIFCIINRCLNKRSGNEK